MSIEASKIHKMLMESVDPNSDYTPEDFQKEFGHGALTAMATLIPNPNYGKMPLKFVNKSKNENPDFASVGAAGFDLRANLDKAVILNPMQRAIIPTGLYFDIPVSYEIQVRSRSGLAAKHGISVLNGPGTIDSDYTGEVGVILINLGSEPFVIENSDRIAQAVMARVESKSTIYFEQVEELAKETERKDGGFGSTGVK